MNLTDLFFTKVAYADVDSFVRKVDQLIVNPLIVLLFAVALAIFLYGVFQFMSNLENDTERTKGKMHILWGLVGLVIMFGVWGLVNIALDTFGITGIDAEKGEVNLNEYNPSYNLGGSSNPSSGSSNNSVNGGVIGGNAGGVVPVQQNQNLPGFPPASSGGVTNPPASGSTTN